MLNILVKLFLKTTMIGKKYERLADAIGNEIMSEVGEKQIEQLNELENDFDYTP